MICLDNTDTLEGGASVDAVVDFTVHGLVGTTFTNIAQGQLSNTNPTVLYTAGAAISIVSVIYVNTHSAAVTVDLYLDPANAGTPRRLIPKALTLGVGYSMHFDGQRLSILDANGGIVTGANVSDTAFAASWDGVTTIAPSKNAVYDAMTQANIVGLKTTDSPTHVGQTLSGLTASLPLFTGASKELVSKSVVDTNTALGVTPAASVLTNHAVVRGDGGVRGVQTSTVVVSDAGEMTNPSQPCFTVQPTTGQTNIAINTETTIIFDTERFDQGGNFASNTFTAPVTGKYLFTWSIHMKDLDTAAAYYRIYLTTTALQYITYFYPLLTADSSGYAMAASVIVAMNAAHTAYLTFYQSGGTQQTDIEAYSWFSGCLLC